MNEAGRINGNGFYNSSKMFFKINFQIMTHKSQLSAKMRELFKNKNSDRSLLSPSQF